MPGVHQNFTYHLIKMYTHLNLSHRYSHLYIVKDTHYNNVDKSKRLETSYMIMDSRQIDLLYKGALYSLRRLNKDF